MSRTKRIGLNLALIVSSISSESSILNNNIRKIGKGMIYGGNHGAALFSDRRQVVLVLVLVFVVVSPGILSVHDYSLTSHRPHSRQFLGHKNKTRPASGRPCSPHLSFNTLIEVETAHRA